ncbi:MAG: AtpZ/AtpI family protein [Capsulimonadales bacterium]|nr:AtpZ/AtpI family protein [Capsulimonadales bacterium]
MRRTNESPADPIDDGRDRKTGKTTGETTSGTGTNRDERNEEEIAGRFPDIETDERLKVSRVDLPDAPKIEIRRPVSEAAGNRPDRPGAIADLRGAGVGYMIGITLVSSIVIGTGLGWAADRFLLRSTGTPWGLILGFFAGTITGFVQMIAVVNRLNAEEDRRNAREARTERGAGP